VPASDFRSAVQIVSPSPDHFRVQILYFEGGLQPTGREPAHNLLGDHRDRVVCRLARQPAPETPSHPLARDIPPHGHDAWVCPLKQKNEPCASSSRVALAARPTFPSG